MRDNVVQFVAKTDSDRTEYDSWKRSLGLLMVDDFDRTTRPRVWVGHFHPDNMIWKEDAGTGNLLFAGVQKGPTTLERGINKRTKAGQAPPRPTMTLHAMDDWFQIKRDESMPPSRLQTDYLAQYPPIKTKLAASAAEIVSAKQFRAKKPGRKTSAGRPFYESFIGTADALHCLLEAMVEHGLRCEGRLCFKRKQYLLQGLCMKISGNCTSNGACGCASLSFASHSGLLCEFDESGSFKWASAASMPLTSGSESKTVNVPDFKFALASSITATNKAHLEDAARVLGLCPRSRPYTTSLCNKFVYPYLIDKKAEVVSGNYSKLIQQHPGGEIDLAADTGHSSARHCQAATTVVLTSDGMPLDSFVDVENPPWKKEEFGMKKLIETAGRRQIDVRSCCIDANATNTRVQTYAQSYR